MDPVSSIALSGLNAASLRVQSSASNLANMDDQAPLPGSGVAGPKPYAPTRVSMTSLGAGGVQAQLQQDPQAYGAAYAPSSPYADPAGMVATPNVDMAAEAVDQVQALAQFRASVLMIKAQDQMQTSALDLLR
ncbi:MAG: putative flagellar basal-body rod protein FlgC [Caulobacteraceae bacterium]|jgi:flagellar basal-body rod protein FlgC|nr:putative flagellar basal-body rod protein FlgC [Caulobacteraceae bacterium]